MTDRYSLSYQQAVAFKRVEGELLFIWERRLLESLETLFMLILTFCIDNTFLIVIIIAMKGNNNIN